MGSVTAVAVISAICLIAPFSTPAEDSARIYVYAQRASAAGSWVRITCGDVAVAELKRGMLFAIHVPPGRHTLGVETGVPVSVEVRAGEEAFIRLNWKYQVGRAAIPVLSVVPADRARKEMMYLSYINSKKVLSSLVPKTDPREPAELRLKRRGEK